MNGFFLFRCLVAAIVLVCVSTAYSAHAANLVVYREGQVLDFGLSEKRFACTSLKLVEDFVTFIHRTFGDKGSDMLWSPIQNVSTDGTIRLRPKIEAQAEMAEAVRNFCTVAPSKVLVLGAFDYIKVGTTDEAVVTLVVDDEGRPWFLYFLNIRVVIPLTGSEEAKRATAARKMLREAEAQQSQPTLEH